ncbi:MAG: indole-3-glycerol phosphate synthase TrpC [Candidatus Brocadia sp.]|uniref:Indole-3-glycerol phosphate synthase n=1 Tax=Candidatus Brocadia fulgida TaxID=380242 RepID=A0A0M2UY62_9BACT|nr:MAG: indole-3-glycerol phosphate synthase [Candidatus Brocadia fulgida]MCC6325804.1 indole-3-glycerol phosphate synthase TrpC [Candidatus Brocadia sp.]MCE7911896.1 indole-3-glycerol phosphate synthase TrpC [Candidatus Brocadia sp. AMX3]MBV6519151.1 Indole-3-glycerol phosphate synthase [Candidatus Brocadia fulgida]MDG5997659.1 indole-3-glycerol phosphate synthase TrpC [Candidatus Brocadia sp.]
MTILDTIYHHKIVEVEKKKKHVPLGSLEKRIHKRRHAKSFGSVLQSDTNISIIAEIKKASPSLGVIREDFQPTEIARLYQKGGAAAISVLTDEKYFQGKLSYLTDVKRSVDLPVLRKDFIIDPYQIYEAQSAGADAILLIAALLSKETIQRYLDLAKDLEMDCLVEVHTESELQKVLQTDAAIIGINNRDLATFSVSLETTFRLRSMIPEGKIIVSESGIKSRSEIVQLFNKGINAILVGETLMKSNNIPATLQEFLGKA